MMFERIRNRIAWLPHLPSLFAWHIFRLRHRDYASLAVPNVDGQDQNQDWGQIHERNLRATVTAPAGQSFLEIGIGWTPRVERMKAFQGGGVRYTACDFALVCQNHRSAFQAAGMDMSKIRFQPNRVGTYGWSLMELLRNREQFDVIYLDGHHTFNIDLPAVLLADKLLKPGGYLLLDDVEWTLDFMKRQLYEVSYEWSFYRSMYNFDEYEPAQQAVAHIKLMAETLLIDRMGYQKVQEYSTPFWWALRKNQLAA